MAYRFADESLPRAELLVVCLLNRVIPVQTRWNCTVIQGQRYRSAPSITAPAMRARAGWRP